MLHTARTDTLSRSARWTAAIVAIAAAAALLAGCGSPASTDGARLAEETPTSTTAADSTAADAAATTDTSKTGEVDASSAGLVLNVQNCSTYDLTWAGTDSRSEPATTPKVTLPKKDASGACGTDRIVFSGTNIEIHPTWVVSGTVFQVYPAFGVPLVGANGYSCTTVDVSAQSPVGMTHCDIGSGWDPDAHVTFSNR